MLLRRRKVSDMTLADVAEIGRHHGVRFIPRLLPDRPVLTIDPALQFGRVCVENTRIPAESIAECVAAGDSVDEVAADYAITREHVLLACWWEVQVERARRSQSKRSRKLLEAWGEWADEHVIPCLGGWDGHGPCEDPPPVDWS